MSIVSSVVVGVSLSLPLGNMDGSSGVGDVASGTSVGSSDSGDGSGGNADSGERGRGGDLGVAGDDRGNSVVSRVDTVVGLSLPLAVVVDPMAISETVRPVATVQSAKSVASVSVIGISLGLSLSLPLAVVEAMAVSETI